MAEAAPAPSHRHVHTTTLKSNNMVSAWVVLGGGRSHSCHLYLPREISWVGNVAGKREIAHPWWANGIPMNDHHYNYIGDSIVLLDGTTSGIDDSVATRDKIQIE